MKYILLLIITILNLFSLNAQTELNLLGTWSDDNITPNGLNARYNEIWGMDVNNHEYAIIGSTYGTHFIDVSDPENPIEKFVVRGKTIGSGIIHRDYHDYKGYLYAVSDEGQASTLQIIDCKYLPDSVHIVYDSQDLIRRTHNIFIDSVAGRLYSLLSQSPMLGSAAMRIFDLSNPELPTLLGSYSEFDGYHVGHVHDAYIKNDTAYMNCGPDGFLIVDFINIDTPNVISILETNEYPQSGYNHSGWLTDDGQYYIMADETWGKKMKILDVSNLPEIEIIDTIGLPINPTTQIPHNQLIKGDYLYASYYIDGLQIWNLSDINNAEIEYFYPTSTLDPIKGYFGNWGVYPYLPSGTILASDLQNGLFVMEGFNTIMSTKQANNIKPSTLTLFPNPSKDKINIEIEELKSSAELYIYNIDGSILHKTVIPANQSIYTFKFPISMNHGTYIVEVKTVDNIYRSKFVVH